MKEEMDKFLLVVESITNKETFLNRYVIEAEDFQKVKYHYHRTRKSEGWNDTDLGKHTLEGWHGLHSDIHNIKPLDNTEYEILEKYLRTWPKI